MLLEITKKKYFKITYAIILNLATMVVFMSLFDLCYELPDDSVFSQLITDGCYDFHFMNYFICSVIGMIQNIIYPLNAYVFVSLLFSFCAFTAISRVFLDKFNLLIATGVIFVINGFYAVNHYETISFSKLPALLTIAGFLCVIHYTKQLKWKCGTIIGGILVVVGCLYRFEIFAVSLVFAFFYVVGKSATEWFTINRSNRKIIDYFKILFEKKRLLSIIVILIVCFSSYFTSNIITTSSDELKYFTEYTQIRSNVYDYDLPSYEECKNEYDKINIDENDLKMLKSGYLDDEGAFSIDKLNQIRQIQIDYNKKNSSLLSTLKLMIISEVGNIRAIWKFGSIPILNHGREAGNKGVSYFLILIILAFYVLIMRKRNYIIPIILSGVTFAFYFYLWIDLKVPFRALYMLLIGMVIFLLYSIDAGQIKPKIFEIYKNKKKLFNIIIISVCFIMACFGTYLSHIYNQKVIDFAPTEDQNEIIEYINNNSDKKYECLYSVKMNKPTDNIFIVKETDETSNYRGFDNVYYRLPYSDNMYKSFGTDNLYSNIVDDNIYVVDNTENSQYEMMKQYYEKHYNNGNNVNANLVDKVDKYNIYKFSK